MKLQQVQIEGYRSIRERTILFVEPFVTVVLGPNDHGKTNLLNAMQHLNNDQQFDVDEDLNWDSADKKETLPSVVGIFVLSDTERKWLMEFENAERDDINLQISERDAEEGGAGQEPSDESESINNASKTPTQKWSVTQAPSPEEDEVDLPDEQLDLITIDDIPKRITLSRTGANGTLLILGLDSFQPTVQQDFLRFLPRIELIEPITKLNDSVSAAELAEGKNEFMRGIFYYAGLDPKNSEALFEQTDRNQMTISRASKQLNDTLRESWSQGKDLSFRLTHQSKVGRIELQIDDPSVTTTYVRASRRSSGFTHYFSLKTILYARQKDHPAESYILLFDEPGVFLHPSGQFDLLQVLETLSIENQTLYVTHSLFMINKTFPTRHRLIMKSKDGTQLDGKPYVGRWQAVLSGLGMALTGSILFANHVLLTEGDSDPIYIYAMIQKAVAAGKCNLDINPLTIMSTGESRHADVILRLLYETRPLPRIAVITDGDKGGKDRLSYLRPLLDEHQIGEKLLTKDTSIEDHLPMLREIYVPSVCAFVEQRMMMEGKVKPDEIQFQEAFLASFDSSFDKGKVTQGISDWTIKAAMEIGELSAKPSKVGIAREYAIRLLELDNREFRWEARPKALVDWIEASLCVPRLHSAEKNVLADQIGDDLGSG